MHGKPRLHINLPAILHNYQYLQSLGNDNLFAVIKSNAYGLGMQEVAHFLEGSVYGFAVSSIDEALFLRQEGVSAKILLLTGFCSPVEYDQAITHNIILAITTIEQARHLLQADKLPEQLFLKLDSGMSRFGLNTQQYNEFYPQIAAKIGKENIVLMSHFACSDEINHPHNALQIARFQEIAQQWQIAQTSFSNSYALINNLYQDSYSRAGIALYGGINHPQLHTALELFAPIVAIKTLAAGEKIGYGATYTCTQTTKVALIAIGYGRGIFRALGGQKVWVNGQYLPILGVISMDVLAIDVSESDARIGDRVELLGTHINAETQAQKVATISYEFFTHLSTLPKIYH